MQVHVETPYGTLDFPIAAYYELIVAIKAARRPVKNAVIAECIQENAKIVMDRRGLAAIGDIGLPATVHWRAKHKTVHKIYCVVLEDGRELAYSADEVWNNDVRKIDDYDKYQRCQQTRCRIIPDDLIAREIEHWRSDGGWLIPMADWHKYDGRVRGIAVRIVERRIAKWVRCVAVEPKQKDPDDSDSDSFESYEDQWEGPVPADAYLAIVE